MHTVETILNWAPVVLGMGFIIADLCFKVAPLLISPPSVTPSCAIRITPNSGHGPAAFLRCSNGSRPAVTRETRGETSQGSLTSSERSRFVTALMCTHHTLRIPLSPQLTLPNHQEVLCYPDLNGGTIPSWIDGTFYRQSGAAFPLPRATVGSVPCSVLCLLQTQTIATPKQLSACPWAGSCLRFQIRIGTSLHD